MFGTIGEVAGRIWNYLDKNGEATLTNLKKDLGLKSEEAAYSIGWLAREEKIIIAKKGSSTKINLKK